jgi:hypothetical protein
VFVPVWLLFSLTFLMAFDNPEWAKVNWLVGLCYLAWAYPVALISAAVAGWILYARGRHVAAVSLNLVPLLWVAPIVGIILWVFLA